MKTKSEDFKMEKSSGNVFLDIGFPPDEAQNLLLRADLMIAIEVFKELPKAAYKS